MSEQHFWVESTTKTRTVRLLAQAFCISLALHAALFGILWRAVTLQPPQTPDLLRIELAPRAHPAPAAPASTPAAQPRGEPKAGRSARAVGTRSDHLARASTSVEPQAAPLPVAPPTTASASSAEPDPAAMAATPTQEAPALDLRVLDWLARYRAYPLAARRAHIEGVVQLRVTLMPDGRLVDATVERSSGHPLLDQAALELLARASPLPAEFASGRTERIELQLPIVYRLRAAST